MFIVICMRTYIYIQLCLTIEPQRLCCATPLFFGVGGCSPFGCLWKGTAYEGRALVRSLFMRAVYYCETPLIFVEGGDVRLRLMGLRLIKVKVNGVNEVKVSFKE